MTKEKKITSMIRRSEAIGESSVSFEYGVGYNDFM